jgi:tetratricopeptide (TPR) repeat protein
MTAVEERMRLGHSARQAGREADALAHYRSAVEAEPANAEANTVYGLMLLHLGRTAEAEAPIRRAVSIAPGHPALLMNLAQWFAETGKPDEAAGVVEGVVAAEPQHWWAWDRLGELRSRQGRHLEAAECYEHACRLRPQDAGLVRKFAQACRDGGRAKDAERLLVAAARLDAANVEILRQQAMQCETTGDWAGLERIAQAWVGIQPQDAGVWRLLARAQSEGGAYARAAASFGRSLEIGPRDAVGLATWGRLCLSAFDYDGAARALDESEAVDPDCTPMLSTKASLLMVMGDHEEAQSYARRAIAKDPQDASAYKTLATMAGGRLTGEEIASIESLVDRAGVRMEDRVTAAFALAECREALGTAEEGMAAIERANALARERDAADGFAYDPEARRARTDALIALFGDAPPPSAPVSAGRRAVFIVGMPRSGTTLFESILAAHSSVLAGGERLPMRWIVEDLLARTRGGPLASIDAGQWTAWRQAYWEGLPARHRAPVVTDKNPWNFDAIGLILRLLPDARIIHVRRNPLDTGYSTYRSQFSRALPWTTRLEHIGHYYGEYARLMAHWERTAAGRFTTFQYEDFAHDFDASAPALLAAAGLAWEPACANFWENRRAIGTLSTMGARRRIESRAGSAASHSEELKALEESLAKAGVDPVTGAWRGVP